jgi:chromosome segregation ATPase
MQYHRRLKDCHAKTLANLESLRIDHQATVNELRSLKSKLHSLDNKLEHADDIELDFEVLMLDGEEDRLELEGVKSKLATTSGKLVCLTQKYENAELNYQQTAHRLASSLTELKNELDNHLGTKQELADAAAGLIVAHSAVLDAAIDINKARDKLLPTVQFLTQPSISIRQGMKYLKPMPSYLLPMTTSRSLKGCTIDVTSRKRWRQKRIQDGHCIKS